MRSPLPNERPPKDRRQGQNILPLPSAQAQERGSPGGRGGAAGRGRTAATRAADKARENQNEKRSNRPSNKEQKKDKKGKGEGACRKRKSEAKDHAKNRQGFARRAISWRLKGINYLSRIIVLST